MRVILPRQVAFALVVGSRLISIAVPVVLVGYLLWVGAVVDGEVSASVEIGRQSPYISPLHPGDRSQPAVADASGVVSQRVHKQPVYFDVRVPRSLRELEVTLTYQNLDQLLVEMGPQVSDTPWVFGLQGVEHRALDFLLQDAAHWSTLREGDVVLLQREPAFTSIAEFLANPPPRETIATYRYDLPQLAQIDGYSAKPDGAFVSVPLRGPHRFFTYAGSGEILELAVEVVDTNRSAGADPLTVTVSRAGTVVQTSTFPDDGVSVADGQTTQARQFAVNLDSVAAGVLQVTLAGSTDLIIQRLSTNLDYLAFIGEVTLVGDAESNAALTLTTDATRLTAEAQRVEGLQTILVGDQSLTLVSTHAPVTTAIPSGVKSVRLPNRDVRLVSNGTIAFSSGAWFNPDVASLGSGIGFDSTRVSAIIARYPESRVTNGWRTTTVRFPLLGRHNESGQVKVAVSLPELKAGDQGIRIRRIDVRLVGDRLTGADLARKFWSLVGRLIP